MPFYDFECRNSHRFELKQSFSAEPAAPCPTCGVQARRLISLVPVHFKGSGFYVNDYGKKPTAAETKSEGGETKAEAKAEGKIEAKAESKNGASSSKESASKESASSKEAPASKAKEAQEPAKVGTD